MLHRPYSLHNPQMLSRAAQMQSRRAFSQLGSSRHSCSTRLRVQQPLQCRRHLRATPVMAEASTVQEKAAQTKEKYTLKKAAGKSRYEVKPEDRLTTLSASAQVLTRFGSAAFVGGDPTGFNRPQQLLEIYEFQGCPFCGKVREAISLLDLDALFYPCPKGGTTFRPKAAELSGKSQFPFLVDPNTSTYMLESDAIISYLYNKYGDGKVPLSLRLGPLTTIGVGLGLAPRGGRGTNYRRSRIPEKPITLWAYEASPFCKLAREVLTELELPHIYKSVARNSPKRPELIAKWDVFQVPYIEDPNTGVAMFETPDIIRYLEETYAV